MVGFLWILTWTLLGFHKIAFSASKSPRIGANKLPKPEIGQIGLGFSLRKRIEYGRIYGGKIIFTSLIIFLFLAEIAPIIEDHYLIFFLISAFIGFHAGTYVDQVITVWIKKNFGGPEI